MVCEIKLEIMDQWLVPVARQQLIFEDEVFIDGRTLVSYNIHNGSTIWLVQVTTSVRNAWEEPDTDDVWNKSAVGGTHPVALQYCKAFQNPSHNFHVAHIFQVFKLKDPLRIPTRQPSPNAKLGDENSWEKGFNV